MEKLNKKQQQELLKLARQALTVYLQDKKIPKIEVENKTLKQKVGGVFVTLRKKAKLRGCIGEFETDMPLSHLVQKKAVDAAINDPRFEDLKKEELKSIKIEISVLSPKKRILDWKKIELGKHGVIIKKGFRSGTFLPQVAKETGWNRETFLKMLCSHKLGLKPEYYLDSQAEIYVFTAQVFSETN